MTPLNIGSLLDLACTELANREKGRYPTRLIVHPVVYQTVAQAHKREIDRRLPLMLLGMELQQSDLTSPNSFKIVD